MDALRHLDSYGLQFICESAKALHRERIPNHAPLGYHTPQASGTPQSMSSQPVSQEFYRSASNLGTAIVELPAPQQKHPTENCHPDPEIESAVTNMQRHQQASGMLHTDSNNNS